MAEIIGNATHEQLYPDSERTVTIPACREHAGLYKKIVTLKWRCPVCGGPRGVPSQTLSYDGSRRMSVDGWENPCGHIDYYVDVRREAARIEADNQGVNDAA